ncbi:lipoxygenase, putative [Ricinus communis]|uniref:Lipoxygenase n=1 Tax=Ricinus communis TaxID=3988 RepID=B9RZA1_RICCO|nr:lipoxygenase, putative [Ricinus communis]|eukprot:XP_002519070.3 lipoxygenase 3, chloroplastic [Ricinus communis]
MEDVLEMPFKLKMTALVSVRNTMFHWVECFSNLGQKHKGTVVLQLVSNDIDPGMKPKLSSETTLKWSDQSFKIEDEMTTYKVEFMVDPNFGVPGAITVISKHLKEFYLESVTVEDVIHFSCNSWIQSSQNDHAEKRIFFANKAYLPCQTPLGLKELREMDLKQLRGNGKGIRKLCDRIYDYDTYKDLGNPDKGMEYNRPILGGEMLPYPRRCRTGRPPSSTDDTKESPANESMPMYVPRDEALKDGRRIEVSVGKLKAAVRNLIPVLRNGFVKSDCIKEFSEINGLYKKRGGIGEKSKTECSKTFPLPCIPNNISESLSQIHKFNRPKGISWNVLYLRDDEFGRLTLRGMNPLSIERLKVFPPVSKLDPAICGSHESALKEEHIIGHLNGMSVQQALEENRLFILDYHDIYLPYLERINALDNRKAHATRTIFYLTPLGTLKPIAIEVATVPSTDSSFPVKQVLTSPVDATTYWLWQLAKAHVCSNDSGAHQLIHHWLRVHACTEPLIIAANRQLSVMHPIYKLLKPHMRYTLAINAQAREVLTNANGIVESYFAPEKYCMEITSSAYKDWWRFDMEGLPADLIRRGLAIPDAKQPHGLRLLIEDYPFANDGLLIWSAIQDLVKTYVNYYYPEASLVQFDTELQSWYKESINAGHADVSNANWWPRLSTPDDLISILSTIIWIASAQHAALNFGQYDYGGYVPIRPPNMRRLVPMRGDVEYAKFLSDPQGYFLSSLPNLTKITSFMSILDLLSMHSVDEEYIGARNDLLTWSGDTVITEAFYRFSMEIMKIEKEIEKRNVDPKLRNRCGAGIAPYELLLPSSHPGVTGRGVPNSISM